MTTETTETQTPTAQAPSTDAPIVPAQQDHDPEAPVYESPDAILARVLGGRVEQQSDAPASTEGARQAEPAHADGQQAATNLGDVERAIKVLHRDGVPESVVRDMAKSDPANLAEWLGRAEKRQRDVDAYGNRLKELEGKAATATGTKAPAAAAVSDQTAAETKPDAGDDAESAIEEIADILGREPAQALKRAFDGRLTALGRSIEEAKASAARANLESQALTAAASVLSEHDAPISQMRPLLQRMSEIGKQQPGQFKDADALARAAVQSLSIGTPSADGHRSEGQPAPLAPMGLRRDLSHEDRMTIVAEACIAGKTAQEARRLAGISTE